MRRPAQDFAGDLLSVLPSGSSAVVCAPAELTGQLATNGVDAVVYLMDGEDYSDFNRSLIVSCLQKRYGLVSDTEAQHADYLVRAARIATDVGVERFYPYELKEAEYDPYFSEHRFCIVYCVHKPAYKAYAEFILSESLPENHNRNGDRPQLVNRKPGA